MIKRCLFAMPKVAQSKVGAAFGFERRQHHPREPSFDVIGRQALGGERDSRGPCSESWSAVVGYPRGSHNVSLGCFL